MPADLAPLGLYVHWPFCVSKCPYCDFNSHVRERVDETRWKQALLRELDRAAAHEAPGRRLQTVFFGGGTPSLMPPDIAAAVIARAKELWPAADDLEVTLEANPSSVEAARFAALADAGVNRVSLGVQALDDEALRFLGRAHDQRAALEAYEAAQRAFARTSFDLIYARPGQTVRAWREELDRALEIAGEHLSLYQLTIERGTRFWQEHARGAFVMPDEETQAALYELTQMRLEDAGRPAYEISNHAREGAECRHNLIYWRYQDYVGVGPGAHGRVSLERPAPAKRATRRASGPEAWLEAVERDGHGTAETQVVEGDALVEEALMVGLRLSEGVDRARCRVQTGRDPLAAVDQAALGRLIAGGFVEATEERLKATASGRQRLNAVLERLLA